MLELISDFSNFLDPQLLAAIVGAILALVSSYFMECIRSKESVRVYATLLFNDLNYIQNYVSEERGAVNMRYSCDWQKWLANCNFLSSEQCTYVIQIYNMVYDYSYRYESKITSGSGFRKEDIDSYKHLQKLFFIDSYEHPDFQKKTCEYESLMQVLMKKAGRS